MMGKIFHKQQNKKVLGIEFCDGSIRYALVEFGREIKVLYKGMELPALSFDSVAVASNQVLEYFLPVRNIKDKELVILLQNEMLVSWGLNPDDYQIAWYRPRNTHDLVVGLLNNDEFKNIQYHVQRLGVELSALVPARRDNDSDDDLYAAALHATYVADSKVEDIDFSIWQQKMKRHQQKSQWYLLAAKVVGIFTGIIFCGLTFLYGFSFYKVYMLNNILDGLQNLQQQYDICLEKSRAINCLQGISNKIRNGNKFRTEQVEQILDSMPMYNNEINILRMREVREKNSKVVSEIVLEGRVGEIKQLKKFVENLNRVGEFSRVNIGTGKNIENGSVNYIINIQYGDIKNER